MTAVWSYGFNRTREKTNRARTLRAGMTDAERKLWWCLTAGQMEGSPFSRQHPAGRYILDFYCAPLKLAIEVDGGQHNDEPNIERDRVRDVWLNSRGVEVLRFWNTDVLRDTDAVLETIWHAVVKRKADLGYRTRGENPHPSLPPSRGKEPDNSSPCKGEDRGGGSLRESAARSGKPA